MAEKDDFEDPSTDLASRRTQMSFERTRMSADRTLMAMIRTSLSLLTFGYTLFQLFHNKDIAPATARAGAAGNFGLVLTVIGTGMLLLGVLYHIRFMVGLRILRRNLIAEKLLHPSHGFPPSPTVVTAILLLVLGISALVSIFAGVGPF